MRFFVFQNGNDKSTRRMPWLHRGDEGRDTAAISFGEVPSNL